jgi:putative RNA 2'-phosphotransferase
MDPLTTSKFMSLILRHDPSAAGIALDESGWAVIEELLAGMSTHGHCISRDDLMKVVQSDTKQRYAVSDDGLRIRANQGHSIAVELGLAPRTPPELLYHGTGHRFVEAIRRQGLRPMSRQHVHLSLDVETATTVGRRHGSPVVYRIAAGEMARRGFVFFLSANGVWLVDHVPAEFLSD